MAAEITGEHRDDESTWPVLADQHVNAYLARIYADRQDRPTLEALRHLQERHVLSVPFETVAFYTGEPVPLMLGAVRKIVEQRRGGCCLELNSAFGMLLTALGYQVELLAGRVYRNSVLDRSIGHLALRVTVPLSGEDRGPWLVDVGQGNNSRHPLRIDLREAQPDPHGVYLLAGASHGDIDVSLDGTLLHRMETRPRDLEFARPLLWWYRTSPRSPFAAGPTSISRTENGKFTLRGNELTEENGGKRVVRRLDGDGPLLRTYLEYFGIELDRVPAYWDAVRNRPGPADHVPAARSSSPS